MSLLLLLLLSSTLLHSSISSYNGPCSKNGLVSDPDDPRQYYDCKSSSPPISPSSTDSSPSSFEYSVLRCPQGSSWSDKTSSCRSSSNETDFQCLRKSLDTDAEKQCYEETLRGLHDGLQTFIDAAATRGDSRRNFHLSVKDIHLNMRDNYAKMIAAVGQNIFPLIVATDNESPALAGTGGVYKVYFRNGTMRRIVPVGPSFELHKCLSHMVLGIFSIVSPYFRASSAAISWRPQLQNFGDLVTAAAYALPGSALPLKERRHVKQMLTMVDDYVKKTIRSNSVSYRNFHNFATSLAPLIDRSMEVAAKAHVTATIPALRQLKAEMGEAEWRRTYVVIPTVWPVSLYNIRLQMFRKVMDFKQIKEQVLIVEGARGEEEARTTLGRVVADRALALLVFGGRMEEESMRDHLFSLSTRRDLLSTTEEEAAGRWCDGDDDWTVFKAVDAKGERSRCPMSKNVATMLRQAP